MRRFILQLIIGLLAFVIGVTAAMVAGKVNPFQRTHSGCAHHSWTPPPPPPPPAPVDPVVATPDEPPPPPAPLRSR